MTILQAKKWLDQCLLNHTGCNTDRQRNRLPTRLIDVGLLEGSEDLRIFIPPDDFSNITRQTDYLTLSYCWGGSQMGHATTVENLGRRCQGFSSEILPKTIRDAIKITRSLGQRYLWVDSLCIIQPIEGNTSDWQFESSQMGQYYQNSFCTISATSATSTSDGCYFQKPGMRFALETCYIGGYVVEDGEANSPRPHGEADLYCVLHPSIPSWDDAVESGTLLTRGWAFQERALSPRILHWTKDAVFWECITLKASEYFPEPMIDDADEDFSLNGLKGMKILSTRNSLKNVLREFWQNQISQYSTKDLTYSSDRLPAISGLAKIVQQYSKYNYLAGLWKSTLLEGLTWHVEEDKNIVRIIPESYVAPSWSWASVK
ncbi:HET-domain-containing protein, partial [Stipitochalara longipes BDJ]